MYFTAVNGLEVLIPDEGLNVERNSISYGFLTIMQYIHTNLFCLHSRPTSHQAGDRQSMSDIIWRKDKVLVD